MTEISWGLGTAFGRPLAAQALFGMTEIPVLMEKCIACEQLLCTFANGGGGGRPPRGPGPPAEGPGGEGGAARRGARGRPPRGPGGEPHKTLQSPNRLYKAPTDNTKPQQTIQIPKIKQRPNISNKTLQH